MAKILIAGAGYIGKNLALDLNREGYSVYTINRSSKKLPQSIQQIQGDLSLSETYLNLPKDIEQVFYLAGADSRTVGCYQSTYLTGMKVMLGYLKTFPQPPRVFFSSSTSVYGQDDGSWVDEGSPTLPSSPTARIILEAEKVLTTSPLPSVVVRFSGIYGPGRTRFLESALEGSAILGKQPYYSNRIHRDDCCLVLKFLLRLKQTKTLYLASDNFSVPKMEVINWLRKEYGLGPKSSQTEPSNQQPCNKRCSNKQLKAEGYKFRFPGYQDGYRSIIAARQPKP